MTRAPADELQAAGEAFAAGAAGESTLRNICARHPDNPQPHFLLGAMLERAGRYVDSLGPLDRALQLDPDHVQALSAKALVLHALGRPLDARSLLEDAGSRQPANPQLLTNLGTIREATGDFQGALQSYDEALAHPDFPLAARLNRGYVLTRLGRLEDALHNNQLLAVSLPENADAHFNVAEVLLALGRPDEARAACNRALAIQPTHAKALIDRSLALAALGKVDEAQHDLDMVRSIDPGALAEFNLGFAARAGGILEDFGAYSIYFHLRYERLEQCDWTGRDELERSVAGIAGSSADPARPVIDPNIPFRTLGLDIGGATRRLLAQSVAGAMEKRAGTESSTVNRRQPNPGSRIRVGYVSPDFRIHPAAYLTRQLYKGHDRSRFEVIGYGITPSDGSWIAGEVRSGFDKFRELGFFDGATIARQAKDDGIDILVDLAGYTNFSRSEAFALRPAPLQVSWLGYPGTLGARYIDYALVDRVACPEGEDEFWTEKLVRLPNTYFIADSDPHVDAGTITRAGMGLPDEGFVFCCFNNAWKIEPQVFSLWMDLLREIPGSVLWLLAFRPEVIANLRREAAARGIDPQRLVFGERLPNENHLPRYRLADLFLDTLYYNAHTTAIDALREGIPVVTAPGRTMPSRVGASLLTAAGVPELICKDLGGYRDKALALARNPMELARIRAKLMENRGRAPLFDTARFIRNLETAFELMWDRHRKGLPPQAFDVREVPPRPAVPRWF
jgi:protein O-GlcNAc transferase